MIYISIYDIYIYHYILYYIILYYIICSILLLYEVSSCFSKPEFKNIVDLADNDSLF